LARVFTQLHIERVALFVYACQYLAIFLENGSDTLESVCEGFTDFPSFPAGSGVA
jgi:hypothetical protein